MKERRELEERGMDLCGIADNAPIETCKVEVDPERAVSC